MALFLSGDILYMKAFIILKICYLVFDIKVLKYKYDYMNLLVDLHLRT
jgi:hypothetical protein